MSPAEAIVYSFDRNSLTLTIEGQPEGAMSEDDQIMGTYLHGIFESSRACQELLRWAGLDRVEQTDYATVREQGIDRLADAIEDNLDRVLLQKLIPELVGEL